jgi:TetR/AcrR family transcriptional regulator
MVAPISNIPVDAHHFRSFLPPCQQKLDRMVRNAQTPAMQPAAAPTSPKNRQKKPAGRLRQARIAQILEAAEAEFAAKGFDGTTTADIAARAALPKANIHYYFGTKDKIYRAVLDQILALWLDEADFWFSPNHTPREALTGYIAAKLTSAREKPLASRIYAGELLRGAPHISGYLHIALRDRVARLSTVIDSWTATGALRPIAPAHLLFCIWAMTQTYADFSVQIGAVLGQPTLDDKTFATAAQTVTTLVIGSLLGK